MPRRSQGARKWLRPPRYDGKGRITHEAVWLIRDGKHVESTGCRAHDDAGAERALAQYIEKKHRPSGSSNPSEVQIGDVLNVYMQNLAPKVARPEMLFCTVTPLIKWWGGKPVSDIKGATCRAYVKWRVGQPLHHAKTSTRTVGESTARRELETLRAAVNHYHKEHTLDSVPAVTMPPKGRARERWMTRSEVARLLWAAWREKKAKHLARFILLGVYTGTRHRAILQLSWLPTPQGGWIDLQNGVLYRRADGERETKKRRPPIRIPRRLLVHLRRWRREDERKGIVHVVHYEGRAVMKERRAWATARTRAKLGADVVPHIMRHSCATWLMQARTDKWEACGFLGMTMKQLEDTYGHHHPDFQSQISEAF